jgi:hypothetical protein
LSNCGKPKFFGQDFHNRDVADHGSLEMREIL